MLLMLKACFVVVRGVVAIQSDEEIQKQGANLLLAGV
jgi:hypothetical protein